MRCAHHVLKEDVRMHVMFRGVGCVSAGSGDAHAIIYVVDATDPARFDESRAVSTVSRVHLSQAMQPDRALLCGGI